MLVPLRRCAGAQGLQGGAGLNKSRPGEAPNSGPFPSQQTRPGAESEGIVQFGIAGNSEERLTCNAPVCRSIGLHGHTHSAPLNGMVLVTSRHSLPIGKRPAAHDKAHAVGPFRALQHGGGQCGHAAGGALR
jgi:hypothetical protein